MTQAAHRRILVVDSDELNRNALGLLVQQLSDVEVFYALSADEAKASIERDRLDLVICTYPLESSDGLDVLRHLRKLRSEAAFILYTFEVSSSIPHVSYLRYAYVRRPLLQELLAEVRRWLGA